MRHTSKYYLELVARMRTLWTIRDYKNHAISAERKEIALILDQLLDVIPVDLQKPVMDHILNDVPFPERIKKQGLQAEKLYMYLVAIKLDIIADD